MSPKATAVSDAKIDHEPTCRGGGRHPPRTGQALSRPVPVELQLSATQGISCAASLSHCDARRPSRCLSQMRTPGHLLQLVSKPALPQVSDPGTSTLACPTRARTTTHQLLSCRFSLPHELNALALTNATLFYNLLFTASTATALQVAADAKHLGADIGMLSILHTWGQNLLLHPHIHCVIPAGGFSLDHCSWIKPRYPFFLPVKVLSRVFRGKFLDALKRLYRRHKLLCAGPTLGLADSHEFHRLIRSLIKRTGWFTPNLPLATHPRAALLGPIHSSCRHFQSSLAVFRWRASDLPMEGLRTPEPAKNNDAERDRVPASILSPCSSQRIRAHSPLRLSGESVSLQSTRTWQETADHRQFLCLRQRTFTMRHNSLALPTLRRPHGHPPTPSTTRVATAIFEPRFLMKAHPKSGLRRHLLRASPQDPVPAETKASPPSPMPQPTSSNPTHYYHRLLAANANRSILASSTAKTPFYLHNPRPPRQRLPSCLLIENVSVINSTDLSDDSRAETFPIKASDNSAVEECWAGKLRKHFRPD